MSNNFFRRAAIALAILASVAATYPASAYAQPAACRPGYILRAVRGSLKRCVIAPWAVGRG